MHSGRLLGTTYEGGAAFDGTVFSIDPATGDEKLLLSFDGKARGGLGDGVTYQGGLLYGTSLSGGTPGFGVALVLDPVTGKETVLHSFSGGLDGGLPYGKLLSLNGVLYGTTYQGGIDCPTMGCGTVFAITP